MKEDEELAPKGCLWLFTILMIAAAAFVVYWAIKVFSL